MSKSLTLTLTLPLALLAGAAFADQDTEASSGCPSLQASTVFVSDSTGSRKKGSAEKISETHKVAEAQGWDFKDFEIYIENGDLQGFFITYTRPHPCNASP